jgi:hypothetical protein
MRAGVNAGAGNEQATRANNSRIVLYLFPVHPLPGPADFIFSGFLV